MMFNDGFWTNMVQGDESVPGLDDLNISLTNETQQIDDTEVQGIDVKSGTVGSRPHSSRPYSKRSKNFDPKEDFCGGFSLA
ncbi:hypothetical protein C2845_PM01G34710 [Panicum miliaceum]|uniref:Uncharacterized protein n=1 Tax=Panicum miliaceum TaxID=4540 RepID=A0A3L6TNX2_PANMI|nr:hypothetical protein C2845_PM01G34710 [Panicum miliaceum]